MMFFLTHFSHVFLTGMKVDDRNSMRSSLNEYAQRQSALLHVDQVGERREDWSPIAPGNVEKCRITLNNFRDLVGDGCSERAHQFTRIADGLVYLVYLPITATIDDNTVALAWAHGFLSWQLIRHWDFIRNDAKESVATGNLHIHHMCYEIPLFLDNHREPLKPLLEEHGESSGCNLKRTLKHRTDRKVNSNLFRTQQEQEIMRDVWLLASVGRRSNAEDRGLFRQTIIKNQVWRGCVLFSSKVAAFNTIEFLKLMADCSWISKQNDILVHESVLARVIRFTRSPLEILYPCRPPHVAGLEALPFFADAKEFASAVANAATTLEKLGIDGASRHVGHTAVDPSSHRQIQEPGVWACGCVGCLQGHEPRSRAAGKRSLTISLFICLICCTLIPACASFYMCD